MVWLSSTAYVVQPDSVGLMMDISKKQQKSLCFIAVKKRSLPRQQPRAMLEMARLAAARQPFLPFLLPCQHIFLIGYNLRHEETADLMHAVQDGRSAAFESVRQRLMHIEPALKICCHKMYILLNYFACDVGCSNFSVCSNSSRAEWQVWSIPG